MFNIPLKKERGIQAGDFVVPNAEIIAWREELSPEDGVKNVNMMFVVNHDYMRDGKYMLCVPVAVGNERWQSDLWDNIKNTRTYMYHKDSLVREQDPVKHRLDNFDNAGNTFTQVCNNINHYYKKLLHNWGVEGIDLSFYRARQRELNID